MKPPRRIIYIINGYDHGGAELGLLNLVEGGMFEGCELHVVALVRGHGAIRDRLLALGCKASYLVDRPRMALRDLAAAYQRFRDLVRTYRPDIVIASLPQANIVARLSLWSHREVTFVSFEHNTRLAKRIYEMLYRMTSSRVDWVFADAAVTLKIALERLYRRRPSPECRFVVPLVEFGTPARRTAPVRRNGDLHVINAARFTDVKNQEAILRAVARLRFEGRLVRLTLYGEGPNRDAYRALARDLGISEHVEMPGFVADWPSRPADVFVLASRHEGLCIVLLEAMHAGLPAVAPLIGGIRDYGGPEVMQALPDVTPEEIARAIAAVAYSRDGSSDDRVARAADMVDARYGKAAIRTTYRRLAKRLQTHPAG